MRMIATLLCSLLLAACAGTPDASVPVAATGAKVWYSVDNRAGLTSDELTVLTERLVAGLGAAQAPAGAAGANHLKITITSYRMLHQSGRAVVGMVSGTDHIASTVQLIEPANRRLLDEKRVLTKTSKAIGSADGMLREHADEIARYAVSGD